ncbi:pca operon transcription factor PcaQ [Halomonas caseinilytica]|uniref:LysR family transcriptional regulator, pca operon transcriptional activator n=1 Tax=Halomonas caseinilytica TaxID=438744 RepID=A0A1M6YS27_9GAMM|nr:pca operon transcription factor PcaQ [Halomonas caseinilytica]SHL21124.1 LysR family transcriptional regulator, pca operon transcriptional activator [Halomonas caseinilytica]
MLSPRIKLRHLQAFLEVAKHRSFARAAESLAITQPGVSKTIRELEDILGTELFERGAQGVALSQSGLTFLRHAGPAIRTLEEGISAVGDAHQGARWLRVGALSTVESHLLPTAIRRWQATQSADRVGVNVVTGRSAFLLSQLRLGELDLVVGRMTEAREIRDLTFEHLYYEPLMLVVRAGHPLAGIEPLAPSRLTEFPWVIPPPQTTLRQQVDSFCVRHSLDLPAQLLETLSLPISHRYTQDGDAIWVAPREAVIDDLEAGRVVELALRLEQQGGSVGLCTNASMEPSLALEGFCEVLRGVAAESITTRL